VKQVINIKFILMFLALFFMKSAFAFKENWKVLIYMQADNDLYEYALKDIAEIARREEVLNVEVIIRLDTPGNKGVFDLAFYKSVTSISEDVDFKDFIINYYLEDDFKSQSDNLEHFITDYSSENSKNILIVWGHGEGYSSEQYAQFGGVALDEFPQSKLTLTEVSASLETFNLVNTKNLDILIMDACLMQTIESAYEVQNFVEYYVGSSQIQNFNGLPYTEFLNELSKTKSSYDIVKKIPALYLHSLSESATETMSSINTLELQNVFYPSMDKLFREINDYINENPLEVIALKSYLQTLPFFLGNSKDISTLLLGLKEYFSKIEQKSIINELNKSLDAINRVVISSVAGQSYFNDNTAYFRGHFKGLGVWVPTDKNEYEAKIEDFKSSSIYESGALENWFKFLFKLFQSTIISPIISSN
jgi:hypothetical protein